MHRNRQVLKLFRFEHCTKSTCFWSCLDT